MSILSLNHFGHLADAKAPVGPSLIDRIFTALYRARMAQAERVIDQYCPIGRERFMHPDPTDYRSFTCRD
ncbi:MAG: hypothetical protein HXX10_01255 [Rhodoplanes sp.]|uniref:hypothetical protein n=1 Tax=Rhodoplanes sp. TaxID=1968906 RepID=UPI0017E4BA60|nr:hypothetical protein [Rhodoplanes sp.]NVO12641.1 hypothetical protein [Rhodoplanes sp.]